MRAGIFAKTFARSSLESSLDAVVEHGITAAQFNLALTGGPSLPNAVPTEIVDRVAPAHRQSDLEMVAVSGTYNMAHPDPQVRERGARGLRALIEVAPALGTRVVTLCTGSRDAHDMWRRHPDNSSAEAWRDMRASVTAALEVAEAYGVTLGVEPEHNNVVHDARAGRRLLDELGSRRLRIVLDAANLVPEGGLGKQESVLGEAFELLGEDLVLAHAKDVCRDGSVVAAGRGDLDYELYVSLLRQAGYQAVVVLHGLTETEVPGSLAFLRDKLGSPASLGP